MDTTKYTEETPAETITAQHAGLERLQDLQERYNHEIMDEEERCELRDRIAAGLARMAGYPYGKLRPSFSCSTKF